MRQDITHQLVGYDPQTESLVFERDIPSEYWDRVKSLLDSYEDDPDHAYSYPLQVSLAADIMGIIGKREDRLLNYYIECFSQD